MAAVKYVWGKSTIFVCCVVLAAIAVGISNYYVFYDSFWMATILLIMTVGVAAVTAYYSGDATEKIRRYCIVFHLVIGVFLCINLASHFVLAREVSAALEGVESRHTEEDRQEGFKQADAERQAKLIAEQRALEEARQRALRAEAAKLNAMRRMGYRGDGVAVLPPPAPAPTIEAPKIEVSEAPRAKREEKHVTPKSPEQIRREWNAWLTFWAFADVFASVIGGLILAGRWEWDRNRDGIPDHLQHTAPPLTSPFTTDANGKVIWAPGYGPNGWGHQPENADQFPPEIDANGSTRRP